MVKIVFHAFVKRIKVESVSVKPVLGNLLGLNAKEFTKGRVLTKIFDGLVF